MAGKHALSRCRTSRIRPIATGVVVAALLVGGAAGAVHVGQERTAATGAVPLSSASGTPAASSVGATPSPSTTTPAAPATTRAPQRASRGNARSAAPSPTRTATQKPVSKVVGTGSCGASYYDEPQATANGEQFDPEALTAAHKTWAFGTRVRVTNPANGKSVVVRINDRGPYVAGRCIDLSRAAFRAIAPLSQGELTVNYAILAS